VLLVFVNALQPVFLVGAAIAATAFLLTWLLRETPLRETTHPTGDLATEQAATGATGSEALLTLDDGNANYDPGDTPTAPTRERAALPSAPSA
jgi:hypothetical protein